MSTNRIIYKTNWQAGEFSSESEPPYRVMPSGKDIIKDIESSLIANRIALDVKIMEHFESTIDFFMILADSKKHYIPIGDEKIAEIISVATLSAQFNYSVAILSGQFNDNDEIKESKREKEEKENKIKKSLNDFREREIQKFKQLLIELKELTIRYYKKAIDENDCNQKLKIKIFVDNLHRFCDSIYEFIKKNNHVAIDNYFKAEDELIVAAKNLETVCDRIAPGMAKLAGVVGKVVGFAIGFMVGVWFASMFTAIVTSPLMLLGPGNPIFLIGFLTIFAVSSISFGIDYGADYALHYERSLSKDVGQFFKPEQSIHDSFIKVNALNFFSDKLIRAKAVLRVTETLLLPQLIEIVNDYDMPAECDEPASLDSIRGYRK